MGGEGGGANVRALIVKTSRTYTDLTATTPLFIAGLQHHELWASPDTFWRIMVFMVFMDNVCF